ncbi:glycosyltransferase family 2 protein [Streptomyces sp. R11]|uniref:Glycosyltransferase family 2 protein n=1 Tax=Streptomyces sp. R11 TaxID=3238625 RepID=A0AB39N0X4_9ACTN
MTHERELSKAPDVPETPDPQNLRNLQSPQDPQHPQGLADPPALSIVIPAYNEQARLPRTLDAITAHLTDLGSTDPRWAGWEIVVADDGSGDTTRDLVTARQDPRIRLRRGRDLDVVRPRGRVARAGAAARSRRRGGAAPADRGRPRSRTTVRCVRPWRSWWAVRGGGWTECGYGT